MAPLPMEQQARLALQSRNAFAQAGDIAGLELIELDCVATFQCLLRGGPPRLRQRLVKVAQEFITSN